MLATATGAVTTTVTPAAATPVCVAGFSTIQNLNWLLRCRKTVPVGLIGVTVTQANNAVCRTDNYWNFGPKVTTSITGRLAVVEYICGHVEG